MTKEGTRDEIEINSRAAAGPWYRLPTLQAADERAFVGYYWATQRHAVRWVGLLAAVLTVLLAYRQFATIDPAVRSLVTVIRLGFLVPSLLAASALTLLTRPTPLVRNLMSLALLMIALLQVAVHSLLMHSKGTAEVPFAAFQLTIVFFYMLSAVGIKRAVLVCVSSSVAYVLMVTRLQGHLPLLLFHGLMLANAAGFASGMVVERLLRELYIAERQARSVSLEDSLTGIPNRRGTLAMLDRLLRTAQREQRGLTVIMVDADYFKNLNDSLGHVAGDKALVAIARVLQDIARRPLDTVGRFGGEEFLLVGIDGSPELSLALAQECCSLVRREGIPNPGAPLKSLTVSVGVWYGLPGAEMTQESVIALADAAMYAAKQAGRNRVVMAGQAPSAGYKATV